MTVAVPASKRSSLTYIECRRVGSCKSSGSLSHVRVRRLISKHTLTYTIQIFGRICLVLSCFGRVFSFVIGKPKVAAHWYFQSLAADFSATISFAEKNHRRENLGIIPALSPQFPFARMSQ